MRIRKGDRVQVMSGKNRGKTGEVIRAMPTEHKVLVAGVNIAKRHHAGQARHDAGRDHRQGHAAARVGGGDHLLEGRPDAGPLRDRRGRHARSGSVAKCGERAVSADRGDERPRLAPATTSEIRAGAQDRARPLQHHGGARASSKIVINMRRRSCHPAAVAARGRGARPRDDHRPEAGRHQGPQVDRRLQAPRGQRDRGDGDACGATGCGSSSIA